MKTKIDNRKATGVIPSLLVALGLSAALQSVASQPPACTDEAYLWLDASAPSTIFTNASGVVTNWTSRNASGVNAAAYTLSGDLPAGPVLDATHSPNETPLVSFGTTTSNRDLRFAQSTTVRTVFFVGTIEQNGNAFLLGDKTAFNFHRGTNGEYWHATHGAARNGKTYRNNVYIASPTTEKPAADFGLIEVVADADLTASQLCYDRTGSDPRRGGKDVAELLVFNSELSVSNQVAVREYLLKKWNLGGTLLYDTAEEVHRNDADLSAGFALSDVFTQGNGAYGFTNVYLTGNLQASAGYTLVVEEGDRIVLDGGTLNGRNKFAYDIRGGTVTFPATASTWWENASFKQSGGVFTSLATGTTQSDASAGLLIGYLNESVIEMAISGGTFTVPSSSINFYNSCTMTVSNATVSAKGVFRSGIGAVTVNIEKDATFRLGSLGWKANAATVNLNGGTLAAYENATLANDVNVLSDSVIRVPTNVTLTVSASLAGVGALHFAGGGHVVFTGADPSVASITIAEDGTTIEYSEKDAIVVRAHPRLTSGLDRESLIGIKFKGGIEGALAGLTVRFDLTNCAPADVSDVRLWRQPNSPIPFAFYEDVATDLTSQFSATRDETTSEPNGRVTVSFEALASADSTLIYPRTETRSESDYLWITAKIADNLATNAEIWASIEGDSVRLGKSDFILTNAVAKAPHRPFPYRYQIGAYVRQDRLVDNGSTTWDIFSNATSNRYANLTDVIVIYSLSPTYSNGKFQFGHWDSGRNDTASTAHLVADRNRYHPACLVRGSMEKGDSCTANGITGGAFEVAGAGEATRRQFAEYVVDFCRTKGLDGMDLDYEWATGSTNHRQWQNIGLMMRELSEHFFDAGLVLSLSTRSHDTVSTGGMPDTVDDYGAFHTADFITSQAYGAGNINAGPTIQARSLAVCTKRGVPKRRVVLGQAIYSCQGQWGWDQAVSPIETYVADPLRRFDLDTVYPQGDSQVFEGPSSYRAQCAWARTEGCGGVMSWGYYTDPEWTSWASLGRHQSRAIWPLPRVWPAPKKTEANGVEWYELESETDWFWFVEHPSVNARLSNDITFTRDPLVIDRLTGTLDGAGHTLYIPSDVWVTSGQKTALIRTLAGTVTNLKIDLSGRVYTLAGRWNDPNLAWETLRTTNYTSGENHVGVLAAEVAAGATVSHVTVDIRDGAEVKGVRYVGGLVGYVRPEATDAVITGNCVRIAGRVHEEIRNTFDTLFSASRPNVRAVVGEIANDTVTIRDNEETVEPGAELQDVDAIPAPAYALPASQDLLDQPFPSGATLPYVLNVGAGDYAAEVVFVLTDFANRATDSQWPQLVGFSNGSASIGLGVSTDSNCEMFLTGSGDGVVSATEAYPISHAEIRGNGDVGSNRYLTPDDTGRVTLRIENRAGEMRILQNGETILVTDKNLANGGSITQIKFGAGLSTLGGGTVESVRFAALGPALRGSEVLMWADEFEGDRLDARYWTPEQGLVRNSGASQMYVDDPEVLAVTGGVLRLGAAYAPGTENPLYDANYAGGNAWRRTTRTKDYKAGAVDTSSKLAVKYGHIEIRARHNSATGAWPALWLVGQDLAGAQTFGDQSNVTNHWNLITSDNWPVVGEIDLQEYSTKSAYANAVNATLHYGDSWDSSTGLYKTSGSKLAKSSLNCASMDDAEWHLYTLDVSPTAITVGFDGEVVHTANPEDLANPSSGLKPFRDNAFYLILNYALGGSGTMADTPPADGAGYPLAMEVDYVRIYQDPQVEGTALYLEGETERDIRRYASLWLDASETNTMTLATNTVTEWRSVNAIGRAAATYELASESPAAPVLAASAVATSNRVSFGATTANRDLAFERMTDARTIFLVGQVAHSSNAFLLGDPTAFDFHRGDNGELFHSSHAASALREGEVYWNGEKIDDPTAWHLPEEFGLIELKATAGVTASQLCYDRKGNGSTPRRGGKEIAELLIFNKALTSAEQTSVRKYLIEKWGLPTDALEPKNVATVVRAHPRLTRGLARESLLGIRFDENYGGVSSELKLRLAFTNCTSAVLSDLRLWRQPFDKPYAFYEGQAAQIATATVTEQTDESLAVSFVNSSTHIYPKVGARADSDYLWVTATVASDIPTDAEIYVSVENETISLGSSTYIVKNGAAKAPHRVFPYKYQIGTYLRQDWLGGNNAGKLEEHPAERLGNLTDVILINNMKVRYDTSTGLFGTTWGSGDTLSAARVKTLRDTHHRRCMVRAGLTKGDSTMTLNGITAYPIACAAAGTRTRKQLVEAIVQVLDENGLDGLDIDWEYPGDGSGATAEMMKRDWGYYGLLLRDLAAAFFDRGYVLSLCTNLGYAMPTASGVGSDVYGVLHTVDYIDSMAYGDTVLNASPMVMQRAINVCTTCGVPNRRIVVGQAIYAYEGWNPGWGSVVGWLANTYPDDLARRYDADMIWMNRQFKSGTWVWKETFEGPSSYHAKLNWCRAGEYGGAMSWGYYTDCSWDEANHLSLARHQAQAMWPVESYSWPTPEVEDGWYLLKSESDWFWLRDHSNVKARFANDIVLEHDPLPIAQWTGTLDGDHHTLTIPEDTWICLADNPALITQLDGTVKNLTIDLYGRVVSRASRWNDTSVTSGTQPSVNQTSEPGTIAHATANTMSTPLSDHYAAVLACKARWGAYVENVELIVRAGAEVQGPSRTAGVIADMYCGSGNSCVMTNVTVRNYGTIRSVARNTAETDLDFDGVYVGALAAVVNGASGANVRVTDCSVEKGLGGRVVAETGTSPTVSTTVALVQGAATRTDVTESFDPDFIQPDWTHFTTTTSSSPTWTGPYDGVWTEDGTCTIGLAPICFTVGSGASMLTINVIAQLPASRSGALAGWKVGDNTVQLAYSASTNRFDVTYNGTTAHANTTTYEPVDVTATHVYTIAISAATDGVCVYQDGALIVSAPGVKWGSESLNTAYTLGTAVDGTQILRGAIIRGADYDFSANANTHARIFSGYGDVVTKVSTDVALKIIAEAEFVEGEPVIPDVAVNGETLSGAESATTRWLFGAGMNDETNLVFSLGAPRVGEGTVALTLGGDDPIQAALRIETAEQPAGPWTTAAEIASGAASRSFAFAADDDKAFYRLQAVNEQLPAATEGMPVSLTSESRVALGALTITDEDIERGSLEVTLGGAGVGPGLLASLQVGSTALIARSTSEGRLVFDLTPLTSTGLGGDSPPTLTLYARAGLTNGDIRVVSPSVTGLTYSRAVLTAVVADTLYNDHLTATDYGWGYRIPALVTDGAGEVLCLYDVRYGGGDLGTGGGIDVGETYSSDGGRTFTAPHLAIDVVNTCNEKNESIAQARTNDLGDVAALYDPETSTYWLMGMGGRGLNCGDYNQNDVLLYKRAKGAGALKWEKVRSVQSEIAEQDGIANGSGGYGYGFLEGPGHGMVTTVGSASMPKGTLVFPMQYFVDSSFTASSAGAVYSTDHGETWQATHRSTTSNGPQENCVMELDDGSWYMSCKAGYRSNNYAETGRFQFFRTKDYVEWTYVDERYPVPCQQGSCLRLGRNSSNVGQYVYCHTLDREAGVRSQLALVFGSDTTHGEAASDAPSTTNKGVAWDNDTTLMLYVGNTGFKGYNSLAMLDEKTLGVLYEAQGHIYFIRIDVSDRLE